MTAKSAAIFASLLLISTPLRARQEDDNRQRIDLHLYYRHAGWVMGRPTPDDPKAADPTLTRYIFQSLVQAVDPQTGKPYQDTPEPPTCKPADLRMAFRLEKKEFLLGEPILVEFRVELDGPGHYAWSLGGDSTLGRDNTFLFILRNEDGAIVPDPYQKPEFNRGGLGSMPDVKQGAAVSSWLAIQRWCAIDRPGTYDLYCISGRYKQLVSGEHQARVAALPVEIRRDVYIDKNDQLMDVQRNKPSKWYELVLHPEMLDREESPLREQLPPDISAIAATSGLGALAHFKITIRNGTDSENAEMADRWTSLVEPVSARALNMAGARHADAALEAIWYARQDLFHPSIAKWVADPLLSQIPYLDGLAMRPDRAGMELLLQVTPARAVNAFWRLNPAAVPTAIPRCIAWLTHPDSEVRARAESCLIKWTGQSFGHDWEGYSYQRPTMEEAEKIQPRWQEWWEQNKSSFRP